VGQVLELLRTELGGANSTDANAQVITKLIAAVNSLRAINLQPVFNPNHEFAHDTGLGFIPDNYCSPSAITASVSSQI